MSMRMPIHRSEYAVDDLYALLAHTLLESVSRVYLHVWPTFKLYLS